MQKRYINSAYQKSTPTYMGHIQGHQKGIARKNQKKKKKKHPPLTKHPTN